MERQYSESDFQQMTEAENKLIEAGMDFSTPEAATKHANLIGDYLRANPNVPVTVATIINFVNANNTNFVWRTTAQREFDKIVATVGQDKAQQVMGQLLRQGRPGMLANTGDQLFENATLLLAEIGSGREINDTTIAQAAGRINSRPGKPLHYVPMPRQVPQRTVEAMKNDDGTPFISGSDMVKIYGKDGKVVGMRSKNHAEWKSAQRALEEAKNRPSPQSELSQEEQRWREMAANLLNSGYNHSEQKQIKDAYDAAVNQNLSWRKTYEFVNLTVGQLTRRRQGGTLVR